jgi:hypothetical protein
VLEALVWLALIVTASILVGAYSRWAFAQPDTIDTRPRAWAALAEIGAAALAAGVLSGYAARHAARPLDRALLIPVRVGLVCGFLAFWIADVAGVAAPCDLGPTCDISAAPFAVLAAIGVTVVVGAATALGYLPTAVLLRSRQAS